eukprot:CAMPEP_0197623026 /NCGR_PEP_ID=MMETSP1338-20131121/3112_1 /TAXON_ID=43686 ORGANISM="Pelagodinium beii, Strain RCC1491" /NCGR_SAMPLE_ID=MMETSP1338 /ASSEMBLY_ACC=CAM_ASM_000754 /LENGTH=158 /DNA_ID=CAMNT_0043192851 /DNA_START=46 /DNA_END=523 /DNA_ORIENTATION=-
MTAAQVQQRAERRSQGRQCQPDQRAEKKDLPLHNELPQAAGRLSLTVLLLPSFPRPSKRPSEAAGIELSDAQTPIQTHKILHPRSRPHFRYPSQVAEKAHDEEKWAPQQKGSSKLTSMGREAASMRSFQNLLAKSLLPAQASLVPSMTEIEPTAACRS